MVLRKKLPIAIDRVELKKRPEVNKTETSFWTRSNLKIKRIKKYLKLKKELNEFFLKTENGYDKDNKDIIVDLLKDFNYNLEELESTFNLYKTILLIIYPNYLSHVQVGWNRYALFDRMYKLLTLNEPEKINSFLKELPEFIKQTNITRRIKIIDIFKLFNYIDFDLDLLKENKNYSKIQQILEHPFAEQQLIEYIEGKKEDSNLEGIFEGKKIQNDNTILIRHGNVIYRNITKQRYLIWKKLYDLGIAVEPIIGLATEHEATYIGYDLNALPEQLIVKSKVVQGEIWGYVRRRILTKDQLESIYEQMDTIMKSIWDLGYVHGHPHDSNFMVEFHNNIPKVYLIDFDLIDTADRHSLIADFEEYLKKCNWRTKLNEPKYYRN